MAAKYSPLNRASSDEAENVPPSQQIPARSGLQGLYLHFRDSFRSLSTCPKELYVNFFLKFCESYGYFSISQILVIYLHTEFGASDVRAGAVYGVWGAAITFWGLSVSWLNDNFGVRNSLMLGFSISLISSLILATAKSITTIYAVLFFFMPVGTAMGIPMLTVGIKRYTNSTNRGFAFGLYYSIMNVAAFVAGPVVDMFNIGFKHGVTMFGAHWSGNRLVILSTTCTYLASLVVTFLYLREIRVAQELELPEAENQSRTNRSTTGSLDGISERQSEGDIEMPPLGSGRIEDSSVQSPFREDAGGLDASSELSISTSSPPTVDVQVNGAEVETFTPQQRSLVSIWGELLYSPTFWRFSVLTLFLINLNTIFRHLDATLPTYLIRCFGPNYPKGAIYSINPFIIMWLTPVISALTTRFAHFDMIKYGGFVAAASPFFMVFATQTWAVVLFVVLLSFGEAIWSPRVYDYTMTIAPEGREASFSALAAAPLFAAKVPVGLLSGYLVHTYLPDGTCQDGQTMWLIIGLLTLSSPVLITVFESCIREPLPASRKRSLSASTLATEESSSAQQQPRDSLDSSQSPLHRTHSPKSRSGASNSSSSSGHNGHGYSSLPSAAATSPSRRGHRGSTAATTSASSVYFNEVELEGYEERDLEGEGYEEADFSVARTNSAEGLIPQQSYSPQPRHVQSYNLTQHTHNTPQRPVVKYNTGDTVDL